MSSKFENKLIGEWVYDNGEIKKDEIALRIEWLISNCLQKIATDETGWSTLYLNPNDNEFWELTYPKSEMYGGGPPALILITKDEAKAKYLI